MDEMLHMRVNLLKDAGEIDEQIAQAVISFAKDVEEQFNTKLNEENASMLITHVCMALPRIKKGEEINPINEMALAEIKQSQAYKKVPALVKNLEQNLNLQIPKSELGYIALHLCSMEEKNNSKGGKV